MSEADFIKTMLSVQGDEALARLRDFESRLKSDPNDVTALYGSHILTWRQGSVDAAVHLLHQLLSNLPCHPASIQHFSGHLRNNQEYETLANAYLREFPAERSGYLMALIIQRNVRRFDQMKKTLRQCAENTGLGVHFQPFVIASLFDAAQGVPYTSLGDLTLVAETRADYSAQRYDKAGGGPPPVQAWAPLEIGESRAVLAASVADTGGDIAVTFRIGRADEPDGPSIEVPGEAVDADPTPGVGIRHFRATVDGLTPGAEYRYAVGIDGKAPVAVAEINTFRTLGHEPPEVVTGEAEPTGRGSVNLNGAVAGTTLPTRYHFRYGKSPKSLRRQTPTRWLPAGLCGRVRDAGENVYRRLTVYGLTVCFVRPGAPATDGGPHPRCNAAMTIEWPFGKDRNHLNGIGVIDLLSGWRSAAHLRGRVPRAFDSKVFPKPAYPGETLDLSDARFAVTYRARDFNAKAFHPVAWVHAGTGKAVESTISENLAPWAYTGQLESRAFISDGQWHRLSFELDCDSNAWSFCGTNTEEMGSTMERYTYHPIGAALRENRNGNICICFVFGDELDTPEGDIEFGELELVYRSQSLLLPGQGTALIAWPADAAFDPGLLTGGWIGDLDHCWQELGNRPGPKEFVWRFRDTASIKTVCLHQHPVWPAKEVEVAVSDDGDEFRTLWSGNMKNVPADPAKWNVQDETAELPGMAEVKVIEPAARARYIRLRLLSGHRDGGIGLDAIEAFGDAPAPIPSPIACNVSEEITGVGPGPVFAQLVAENDAGRAAGEIVEIPLPADDRPRIMAARVIDRTDTAAAVRFRANAMGFPATATLRLKSPRGKTIVSAPVTLGKWSVARDGVIRIDGLKPGVAYKASIVAANEHGKSKPFPIAIGKVPAKRASEQSPHAK